MAEKCVETIRLLFKRANSNSSKYVGIKYRVKKDKNGNYVFDDIDTKLCFYGCVNCGRVMNNRLDEFIENGPAKNAHPWFCGECLQQYSFNLGEMHALDNNYFDNYLRAHIPMAEFKKAIIDNIDESVIREKDVGNGVEIWIYI